MAVLSQTGVRLDPVLNHNFVVSLIDSSSSLGILGAAAMSAIFDVALGGFSECSGLEMSLKTEDYRQGGENGTVRHFPTRVEWSAITLKKGIAGTALWDWQYGFVEGRGKRRDGVIVLLNALHLPTNVWTFRRGLPTKYTAPQLNATQNAVAIESLEITHEGLYQVPFVGAATGAVSAAANAVVGGF
jgi:phage tail-like protein